MRRVLERGVLGDDPLTMMCHRAPVILAIVISCSMLAGPASAQDDAAREAAASERTAADHARAIELSTLRALQILARARRLEDARAVRCLDPRVSELTSTFRQATERVSRARRAERTDDPETVARETATLRRLVTQARTLERNARECVGHERVVEADWTEVEVIPPSDADRRRAQERYTSGAR